MPRNLIFLNITLPKEIGSNYRNVSTFINFLSRYSTQDLISYQIRRINLFCDMINRALRQEVINIYKGEFGMLLRASHFLD